jgi:YbgC/YbaW family acyl-CoA thioester hydrolase
MVFDRKKITDIHQIDELHFRVMPTDLDPLIHVNNAKFLAFMDLARLMYLYRSGSLAYILKNKLKPVITSSEVLFKKELKLFQKFTVQTQLIKIDDRAFYIKHSIIHSKQICVVANIKGVLIKNKRKIKPNQMISDLGFQDLTNA